MWNRMCGTSDDRVLVVPYIEACGALHSCSYDSAEGHWRSMRFFSPRKKRGGILFLLATTIYLSHVTSERTWPSHLCSVARRDALCCVYSILSLSRRRGDFRVLVNWWSAQQVRRIYRPKAYIDAPTFGTFTWSYLSAKKEEEKRNTKVRPRFFFCQGTDAVDTLL